MILCQILDYIIFFNKILDYIIELLQTIENAKEIWWSSSLFRSSTAKRSQAYLISRLHLVLELAIAM